MHFKDLNLPTEKLQIGSEIYVLKIASTQKSRVLGLSQLTSLPENSGLFFWYGEQRNPKSTEPELHPIVTMCIPFNLTVLFLLRDGRIVHIFNNLEAESDNDPEAATKYHCPVPADLMIELPGDTNLQLQINQQLDISIILKKYNL